MEMNRMDSLSETRAIIHLDLDAFFAAVEVLKNPKLAGKPVLIGGRPNQRGVVATASYPARAYGVHSAMPMSQALRLCPDAIVLPPDHGEYRKRSRQVIEILRQVSPLVEQVSIDEAFVDLTAVIQRWEEAIERAAQIQQEVSQQVGLSASLGVATNKLVAKIASDRKKPAGLTAVLPGEEASFLALLPVRVLWGIGPVTAQKLAEMGIQTVGELASIPENELSARFGSYGLAMARHAKGLDDRPVVAEHERKSVSQEQTFARDVADAGLLRETLRQMSGRVAEQLQRANLAAGTIAIKLRYGDFTTLTRQMTFPVPINNAEDIDRAGLVLFKRAWERQRPVRLLGVAARNLVVPPGQIPLW
jgi:DNA polymerase-4